MAENRDISMGREAGGTGVTVAAVRRVATLAERTLREAGRTEADGLLQDVLAARLIAEEALAMEAAGDPLAGPMAEEALRMAKESWRAAQPLEPAASGEVRAPAHAAALVAAPEPVAAAKPEPEPEPAPAPGLASRPSLDDVPEVTRAEAPDATSAPVPSGAHAAYAAWQDESPARHKNREFAIPYGPAADPVEDRLFPVPTPAAVPVHAEPAVPDVPDAPDAAAPDAAPSAAPVKRPRAAKRVCLGLAVVLLVLLGLVGAAWWGLIGLPDPVQERILLLPDAHAQAGRLNASEVEVEPGGYQMVLNQVASMQEGSRTLRIAFENPAANAYSSRLELRFEGQTVARTGMVDPGQYVETVELDRALPTGEQRLSATVLIYAGATQVNAMTADVAVRVK